MKILGMSRGRIKIAGFKSNRRGKQPKIGKDGKISNQKGAFGSGPNFPKEKDNSCPVVAL